ncbi:AMP-binding protein [Ursidibacter arcticus]
MPYITNNLIARSPDWYYADFEHRALQISHQLQQQQVQAIAIWLEDGAKLACTLLAAWHANVKVLFLPNSTSESFVWARQHSQLLFIDSPTEQINTVNFDQFGLDVDLQKVTQNRPLFDRHNQTEIWLKTSGSTGEAKTIIKTAEEMWLSAEVLAKALPFPADNQITAISSVSIQHIYGLTVHIMMSLVQGWQIGRKQQFFPECISLESHQAIKALLISSPAMLSRMNWQQIQLGSMLGVISSGGALAEKDSEQIRKQLKQPVIEIYGSTETGPIAIRQDIGLWQTLPLSQIGTDENGALWLEAAWAKERQQTADAVEISPQGFVLLGRIDRIVKIGDKRTSLVSVEQDLLASDLVDDCYIAKHPTEQRLAAWVELSEKGIVLFRDKGRKVVTELLKKWLSTSQEKTTVPRFWRFTDKLPRNSQSKISRLEFEKVCTQPQVEPLWLGQKQQGNLHIFQGKVPLDLVYFKGHFAEFPIVPGVVELQWVKEKVDDYLSKERRIARIDNLKFQKFLRPNDLFELNLDWQADKNRMCFYLKTNGEICASGLVIVENE